MHVNLNISEFFFIIIHFDFMSNALKELREIFHLPLNCFKKLKSYLPMGYQLLVFITFERNRVMLFEYSLTVYKKRTFLFIFIILFQIDLE